MALTLACDGTGCIAHLPMDTKPVGRLEQRFYCAACAKVYDEADAEIERERLKLVAAFAKKRAAILGKARERLGVLPDE